MGKFIMFFKSMGGKIAAFFTAGTKASYVAIAAASIVGVGAVSVGTVAIIATATSDEQETTQVVAEVSESETTMIVAEEPTTTEMPTTEFETVTEAPPTTEPSTIALEDLDIKDDSESDETEPVREEVHEQPTTEATTEAPTEAPVSEYACVVKGIDISKWNSQGKTAIDWKKVKDSGVSFVIIRAGYRSQANTTMYADPYFEQHIEGALAQGLQVGVYFYSQATTETEALEEASFLLSIIDGYELTYPVVFDWEPVAGCRVQKANLTKAQATAIAKKFLSTVEAYGYEGMLYSYHSAIKNYFDMPQLADYKAWVAWYYNKYKGTGVQYAIGDPLPEENYPYQMWQYSSTGSVPGIQGNVDMNVAFFSYSGSSVPTTAIVLNLPQTSYTTNVGTAVNLKAGVKGYNTAGLDVSSSVTTTITNSAGAVVTETAAFNTPGVYTVTYTLKDFTGAKKTATAKLTVRSKPAINLTAKELTFDRKDTTYELILEAVKNNIISAKDYEGNNIDKAKITITGIEMIIDTEYTTEPPSEQESTDETTTAAGSSEGETTGAGGETGDTTSSGDGESDSSSSETTSEEVFVDTNGLLVGDFVVTYTVADSKGLSGTSTVTLHITDVREDNSEESTTP